MTIAELILYLGNFHLIFLIFCGALPLITYIYGKVLPPGKGERPPHAYFYSVLIYTASIPGICSAMLLAYALFIQHTNLLEVDVVIYFLPALAMTVTLFIVKKDVDMVRIPGFDRLLGLFTLIGVTFLITLLLIKTRIWIIFGGSIGSLAVIGVFVFLVLKWALHLLTASRNSTRPPFPRPPRL